MKKSKEEKWNMAQGIDIDLSDKCEPSLFINFPRANELLFC